eukprot:768281-Hanusia_phi.AAC.1
MLTPGSCSPHVKHAPDSVRAAPTLPGGYCARRERERRERLEVSRLKGSGTVLGLPLLPCTPYLDKRLPLRDPNSGNEGLRECRLRTAAPASAMGDSFLLSYGLPCTYRRPPLSMLGTFHMERDADFWFPSCQKVLMAISATVQEAPVTLGDSSSQDSKARL